MTVVISSKTRRILKLVIFQKSRGQNFTIITACLTTAEELITLTVHSVEVHAHVY